MGAGAAIAALETAIAAHLLRAEPAMQPAALSEALGIARDHAALDRIGRLAAALADELEALAGSSTARALGEELAHYQPPSIIRALDDAAPSQYRAMIYQLGPAALAARLQAVHELAEAADAAHGPRQPAQRGRTPAARERLLSDIFGALDYAMDDAEDWRDAWAPLAAPQGRLVRLVGVCLEAIGEPATTNLAQVVRRALQSESAWSADLEGE